MFNVVFELNVEIDFVVKFNFVIEVDVLLLFNVVFSARLMMEFIGLDVVVELFDNDFVLILNWFMILLRSSELVNFDNFIFNEELIFVKLFLVVIGGEERLLGGDVVVVRLG